MKSDIQLEIFVNDEKKIVSPNLTLAALVQELSLTPERIAVERNGEVVRRAHWPEVQLRAGDRVEIVHFVGGG